MIVGVDVSSRRVDLAWLEDGKPCRWHQELAKGHLIDRLRSIDIHWPIVQPRDHLPDNALPPGYQRRTEDVTDVAVEYPFGRGNAIAALMATVGVITRQAPPWARVAWPSSGELRTAIGAKNTKDDAWNQLMHGINWPYDVYQDINEWDEHECDALVACIGWTRILEANE